MLAQRGRISEAETSFLAAIAIREEFAVDFPGRPKYRSDVADALNGLGILYWKTKRLDEAEQALERVRMIYGELTEQHPDVADFQHMLGGVLNNIALVIEDRAAT